jgi:hypothetical protein
MIQATRARRTYHSAAANRHGPIVCRPLRIEELVAADAAQRQEIVVLKVDLGQARLIFSSQTHRRKSS